MVLQPERPGPHPTVVLIHGRHGTEAVPWVFARALPRDWLLVAPRGIDFEPETDAVDDVGFSWMSPEPGPWRWPEISAFDDAVLALKDFIESLPDVYEADPTQLYVLGFSQGAAAAYALALQHPGLVCGIAGLVGFCPEPPAKLLARQPLSGLPIFMAVGRTDERVPLAVAQRCAELLRDAGATLNYNEYDTGHKVNSAGLRDLTAWWQEIANQVEAAAD